MEELEGAVVDYLRWAWGSGNLIPRLTRPIATKWWVGGWGAMLEERAEGGGVGGEVTVLKYMLLLLPHFQEWISVGSYG